MIIGRHYRAMNIKLDSAISSSIDQLCRTRRVITFFPLHIQGSSAQSTGGVNTPGAPGAPGAPAGPGGVPRKPSSLSPPLRRRPHPKDAGIQTPISSPNKYPTSPT